MAYKVAMTVHHIYTVRVVKLFHPNQKPTKQQIETDFNAIEKYVSDFVITNTQAINANSGTIMSDLAESLESEFSLVSCEVSNGYRSVIKE